MKHVNAIYVITAFADPFDALFNLQRSLEARLASAGSDDEPRAALRKFINVLNEKTFGKPFDIEVAGVPGDAEMLLKSFRQHTYFEALLRDGDKAVKDACLKVALPPEA